MAEAKQEYKETLLDKDGALDKWCQKAMLSDITYHRVRQQLWGSLCEMIKAGLKLEKELFRSLKSALTGRSQDMDDNKKLAFETAVEELQMMIEEDDDRQAVAVVAGAAAP